MRINDLEDNMWWCFERDASDYESPALTTAPRALDFIASILSTCPICCGFWAQITLNMESRRLLKIEAVQ